MSPPVPADHRPTADPAKVLARTPTVSVIIPLYGPHRGREALLSVTRAWLGQDVCCEVVVAIAGKGTVRVADNIDAARTVNILRADAGLTSPGILRNLAAGEARGGVLYLGDADIEPLGADFLTRALCLADGQSLGQPWMYRLAGADRRDGRRPSEPPTPGRFCFVQTAPDSTIHPYGGERFKWRQPGSNGLTTAIPAVFPPALFTVPGLDEIGQWLPPFHWGGLLIERQLFFDVGGYCQRYAGWGGEDDDLLAKLDNHGGVTRAWRADRSLCCLHYEHPRRYFESPATVVNRTLLAERKASGAMRMIAEDTAALSGTTAFGTTEIGVLSGQTRRPWTRGE